MMHALVTGVLVADPEQRSARGDSDCAVVKILPDTGPGDGPVALVTAYGSTARTLLALTAGDPVAVAGRARPALWARPDGATVAGLDVLATSVMTPFEVRRKRRAVRDAIEGAEGVANFAQLPPDTGRE
ncbi:single-stranded DNA-binding protein [Rubrivivax albus]|uniref:Single-stranded DNA-binding protein n=1 Tax=Rubrivivax albus TaxID=2499835 RepID=A0A437JNP4_9BURK|nr:single-stranded DNA-binding protein [Rubrivivax albus]RVT48389.1 single-stranded DNA-binding protein [Rubrivivax albus]